MTPEEEQEERRQHLREMLKADAVFLTGLSQWDMRVEHLKPFEKYTGRYWAWIRMVCHWDGLDLNEEECLLVDRYRHEGFSPRSAIEAIKVLRNSASDDSDGGSSDNVSS